MFSVKSFLFSFALLMSINISAQKHEFEIFLTGKKIGTLVAEKKVKGEIVMYTVKTNSDAQILWKDISNQTNRRVMFTNGILTESYYDYIENGVTDKFCKINQSGNSYSVHHAKTGKYTLSELANFCISMLYFEEPKNIIKMLDETSGEYVTIKKTATGEYEFKPKNGDKSVYKYVNGQISEIEFHTLVMVKLRPKG